MVCCKAPDVSRACGTSASEPTLNEVEEEVSSGYPTEDPRALLSRNDDVLTLAEEMEDLLKFLTSAPPAHVGPWQNTGSGSGRR